MFVCCQGRVMCPTRYNNQNISAFPERPLNLVGISSHTSHTLPDQAQMKIARSERFYSHGVYIIIMYTPDSGSSNVAPMDADRCPKKHGSQENRLRHFSRNQVQCPGSRYPAETNRLTPTMATTRLVENNNVSTFWQPKVRKRSSQHRKVFQNRTSGTFHRTPFFGL